MEQKNNSKRVVIKTFKELIEPPHKINIKVIGCGGTGSQVLQGLARMNFALEKLGHPGFHVRAYDHDIVTEGNLGRQLFSEHDLDRNKADVLIERINRFYGYSWDSVSDKYQVGLWDKFVITCVDKVDIRHQIFKKMMNNPESHYNNNWIDFGNNRFTGQVVWGTNLSNNSKTKYALDSIGHFGIPDKDDPETPSCSLAEALVKQDLFINTIVANAGMTMLWSAITTLKHSYNAVFVNLQNKMQIKSHLYYHERSKSKDSS